MRATRRFVAAALSVVAASCALACGAGPQKAGSQAWTLTNVNVVDVQQGVIQREAAIRIADGRIVGIMPMAPAATRGDTSVIDGRSTYVIPGLYDMHTHIAAKGQIDDSMLVRLVDSGVLGVRDMGSPIDLLESLAALRDEGTWPRLSPRVWFVGPTVNLPPLDPEWPAFVDATSLATVREAVSRVRQHGGVAVKVHDNLDEATYGAITAYARAERLPVVGHIPALLTVGDVIAARQRSVEHLGGLAHGLLMACSRDSGAHARLSDPLATKVFGRLYRVSMSAAHLAPLLDSFDSTMCEAVAGNLRRSEVWQVPNLLLWKWWAVDTSTKPTVSDIAARRRLYRTTMEMTGILFRAGAPLLVGTDDLGSIQDEMELLVEAGLPAPAVLRAATYDAATFLGVADTIGAVRTGYAADLVLLAGNPLEDIAAVRQVDAVVIRGTVRRVERREIH